MASEACEVTVTAATTGKMGSFGLRVWTMPVHSTWLAGLATLWLGKRSGLDAGVGTKRVHQPPKMSKNVVFGGWCTCFGAGRAGPSLLGGRLYVLRALPIADKCLAQFVLLSLILGIGAAGHTECFADIVHGTVKSELTGKLR